MEAKSIQLNICYACMKSMPEGSSVCPACGNDNRVRSNPENTLPEGTVLFRKYLVGKMIGRGGFGVTYIGYDLDLQLKVAIKEYFPAGVSYRSSRSYDVISDASSAAQDHTAFSKGCEAFLDEARMLASVNSPYIVHVRDFFREHGTAYIVMDYVNGLTLPKAISRNGGRISAERVVSLMLPLIDQLDELHERNIIHRDIKPDNIILVKDRKGIHPVLLDFGAARSFVSSNVSKTYTAVVTPGFAPLEQYSQRSRQGAFTDVYGLCATMYYAITGAIPPAATERSIDNVPVPSFRERGVSAPEHVETAIMHGLALKSENRTQTMQELYAELSGGVITLNSQKSGQKTTPQTPAHHAATQPSSHVRQRAGNTAGAKRRKGKSGGHKIAVILLVLLIVAFAGTSAVYLLRRSHSSGGRTDSVVNETTSTSVPEITVTPTAQPTAVPTEIPDASALKAADIAVGDHVIVGSYEQDNDLTNGPEPIEWIVLDKQEDKALLISRYGLDCKPFDDIYRNVVWKDSPLYTWLNYVFFQNAFSAEEQNKILNSESSDTLGKMVLLSSDEAKKYFKSDEDRICIATEYAKSKGAFQSFSKGNTRWWLRTSGVYYKNYAQIVNVIGTIVQRGIRVDYSDTAVRPAMWVSLDDKAEIQKEASAEITSDPESIQVGSYVTFGTYEQDGNQANGKEPINWLVLDIQDSRVFLLSKYALETKPYHDYRTSVSWESCTLRSWLNNSFFNEAFNNNEKSKVITSTVTADNNPNYSTDPGNTTRDKIFLLSLAEVAQYLDKKALVCTGTDYCCSQRRDIAPETKCRWWLRTPGVNSEAAGFVGENGNYINLGDGVNYYNNTVRPAMWVDIAAIQQ